MKRLRYEGSTLRSRDVEYQARVRKLFEKNTLPRLLDGTLTHYLERVFRWEDVVEAHGLMESNATMGKIVCVINW
ncbi:hypothetical protein P153DRAFT_47964 [Dothidotthia symphoricarpi CBS 119687]|uniref:Uncharacterized protein n=1 Tax=Dothidotthia symphoricarpi CBS 119687 TaxID=1392245 RepID=A0A6A6A961_9PLEO|nr:uncharacterized protein P153DRAFT_47964 [Dothidotthia symphoricarpi CBS 119687]KAF2128086.1 hypothetical protein P153DRAFT_47964 [Dothidotthia symphoricarpi CBS 119687]